MLQALFPFKPTVCRQGVSSRRSANSTGNHHSCNDLPRDPRVLDRLAAFYCFDLSLRPIFSHPHRESTANLETLRKPTTQ